MTGVKYSSGHCINRRKNMSLKKGLRLVIDIAMTVFMPVLMSYELAGAALHEYSSCHVLFVCDRVIS